MLPLIAAAVETVGVRAAAGAAVNIAAHRAKAKKDIAVSAANKVQTLSGKTEHANDNVHVPQTTRVASESVTGNPVEQMTRLLINIDKNIVVLTDTISSFLFSKPEAVQLNDEGEPYKEKKARKKNKFLEGILLTLVAPMLIGLISIFNEHIKPILTKLNIWYEKTLKPFLFDTIPQFFGKDLPEFFNVTVPQAFDSAIKKVKGNFDSLMDGFQQIIRDAKTKIGTWMKEVGTKMSSSTLPGAIEAGGSLISAGNRMIDDASSAPTPAMDDATRTAAFNVTGRVVPPSQGFGRNPVSAETSDKLYSSGAALIGKSETRDNQELQNFFQANIKKKVDPKKTKWCAAFVNSVLAQNGVEGTGSLAASSFETYGEPTNSPRKGDIVVLKHHVGFFDGFNPNGSVRVLGGNQGNEVGIDTFTRSEVIGFRRVTGATTSPKPASSSNLQTPVLDRSVTTIRIPPKPESAPQTSSPVITTRPAPKSSTSLPMRSTSDVPTVEMPFGAMAPHLFYRPGL